MKQRAATTLVRWGFAALGGLLAMAATVDAVANVGRYTLPAVAAALPTGAQLRLRAIDQAFKKQQLSFSDSQAAEHAAVEVLAREPLDARALRLLAYLEHPTARSSSALALVQLAHRVSRRDDLTELVLMDHGIRSGDAASALRHLDIFMRANPQRQGTIFPVMARGLGDPQLRKEIGRYFVAGSPWVRDFIAFASTNGQQPGLAADIVLASGSRAEAKDVQFLTPSLLTRLVEAREFERAFRLLELAGGDQSLVTKGGVTPASTDSRYGYLAWQTVSEGNRSASFDQDETGTRSALVVYGAPGARGEVASKILKLSAGEHVLSQRSSALAGSTEDKVRWQMQCVTSGEQPPFWTSKPITLAENHPSRESFTVPDDCSVQKLSLYIQSSTQGAGLDLQIENFTIE